MIKLILAVAFALPLSAAYAGQVPNPLNAPASIAPGHSFISGANPQQTVDGGVAITTGPNTFTGAQTAPSFIAGNTTLASGSITQASGNFGLFVSSNGLFVLHDSTNGVGFTVGNTASTITGRLDVVPGTSNNPITFSMGGSSFANQGIAFIPKGLGQFAIALPNYTGTFSTPSSPDNCGGLGGFVVICNNSDTLDATGFLTPPVNLLVSHQYGGAGSKGGRWAALFSSILTANTSDTANSFFNGVISHTTMRGTAGGTSMTPLGSAFGMAAYAELGCAPANVTCATNFLELSAIEYDLLVPVNTSVKNMHGISIVLESGNAVAPSGDSLAYTLSGQTGAAPTLNYAYALGRRDGINALSTSAWIMQRIVPDSGEATPVIAGGIDLSGYTITENAWVSNAASISGAGKATFANMVLTSLPTSCSGQPTNTIAAVASVLTLCP